MRRFNAYAMQNNRLIFVLLAIALVLTVILVWAGSGNKRHSWRVTYSARSKEPYGTFVLHDLLGRQFPGNKLTDVRDSLQQVLPTTDEGANYLLLGPGAVLAYEEQERLLDFVAAGNTALLALELPPLELLQDMAQRSCNSYEGQWVDPFSHTDSIIRVNLNHLGLRFEHPLRMVFHRSGESDVFEWHFFSDDFFCTADTRITPLSEVADVSGVNLVEVAHGKGRFYLFTTPVLLTNYFVLQDQGRRYAEGVLSYLQEGPVYWDNVSRLNFDPPSRSRGNQPRLQSDSPLSYVLSQPALAWAWYVLVGLGLLYLLFGARRRQAIVPIWEAHTNTSLAFIRTIGWLYFQRSSHLALTGQAIKLFRGYVLERYGLSQGEDDALYHRQVAAKAGVDEALVREILTLYATFEKQKRVDDLQLSVFNRRLETFYRNAK
jgi:hypothetical protein